MLLRSFFTFQLKDTVMEDNVADQPVPQFHFHVPHVKRPWVV